MLAYNEPVLMTNLFLFTGEETYLLRQKVKAWKDAFRQKHGDINLSVIDADQTEPGTIIGELSTAPFLGEKRLAFIENLPEAARGKAAEEKIEEKEEKADDPLKKFAKDLETIPETSVAVFIAPKPDKRKTFYKALVKLAKVEEFNPLEAPVLNQWVIKMAHEKGLPLTSALADALISLAGQDCWRLAQEVQKLACYSEKPLTREDIDHVVVPTLEANIFHFTDALSTKDHKKAIRNLHRTMAAGEDLRQLFYMIVRQFRLLLQVKSYKQQYPATTPVNMASVLKLHPFVARNIAGQIIHFQMEELKNAYAGLLEIDTDLKTSRIKVTTDDQDELALAVERFILRFCSP